MKHLLLILCSTSSLLCASAQDSSAIPTNSLSNEEFQLRYNQARLAIAAMEYAPAAITLESLLPLSRPESRFAWETHRTLSSLYMNLKKYADAEKHFIAFLAPTAERYQIETTTPGQLTYNARQTLKTLLAIGYEHLGQAQQAQAKYDAAAKSYQHALNYRPSNASSDSLVAMSGLAFCLMKIGKIAEAQKLLVAIS